MDIHHGQPITVESKKGSINSIVILLHGRGASAKAMIPIADALSVEGVRFLIPQAGLNRWYPQSAFGPLEANEPDLSYALSRVDSIVQSAHKDGFLNEQIFFGGFSQGACLASEYVARNAQKYGGLFVFSGALIGPRGMTRNYDGSFHNLPVFIGGSDVDPWVSHDIMVDTAAVFQNMGSVVDFRIYPGMSHTINNDEISCVRKMLTNALSYQSETIKNRQNFDIVNEAK